MAHVVLARKYRPATFEEVVGQEHVTRTLTAAVATGRVAQAFCFTGPRGVGKTSVARILAKALNCIQGPTPSPCGECSFCREIEAGVCLDVQEIDAASNSSVDDVRELTELIRYRPQAARYRLTILDEVHMLSRAAFNALLKTLEEPPEHAVFILATTDVHKLPETILSRCQRYDFRRLAPGVLVEHMRRILQKEGAELAEDSLMLIAQEADGSVRDALSMLEQVLAAAGPGPVGHEEVARLLGVVDRTLVREMAVAVLERRPRQVVELVGRMHAAGLQPEAVFTGLMRLLRDLAVAGALGDGSGEALGMSAQELQELKALAARVSPEAIHEAFAHLAGAEGFIRRSSHPQVVLEMILLRLAQLGPVVALEEIVEALKGAGDEPSSAREPSQATAADAPSPGMAPPGQVLKRLVARMASSRPTLASYLGRAKARWEGTTLVLVLPASDVARNLAADHHEEIAAVLKHLAGEGVGLKLEFHRPPARESPAPPEELKRELAEHPAVQAAVEIFDPQGIQLRPQGPSAEVREDEGHGQPAQAGPENPAADGQA